MHRFLLLLSFSLVFGACSKKDDKPSQSNDSLLAKPMDVEPMPGSITHDTATGLIVDQSRFRTPQHEEILKRFQPIEVATIYHNFRKIRKPGITQPQLDSFTKATKISVDELKAILEEGDLLGWGKH